MEINDTEITTLSTNGDVNLGGADFDSKILELCKEDIKKTRAEAGRPVFDWDSNKGKRARLRLLEKCKEAKLALVNEVSTEVEVESLTGGEGEDDFNYELTLSNFEEKC